MPSDQADQADHADHPDLGPAAELTARVVTAVADDQLDLPSPCPDFMVRDLLVHLSGLSAAFGAAASKDLGPLTDTPPGSAGPVPLADDWRESLPAQLTALAAAWRSPDAWQGMTRAGGVDLPCDVGGVVALNEVTLHGWDVAASIGLIGYEVDETTAAVLHGFLTESRRGEVPPELFGPAVEVPPDASVFHRALGLAGRNPAWTPTL